MAVPGDARRVEHWSYDRLFKEADLVVIAKAGETTDTKDRFSTKLWKVEFIGQDTQFVPESVLKGKLDAKKGFTVLHYRLPEKIKIINGPSLVSFRKEGLMLEGTINGMAFQASLGTPVYMLFLRLRLDGRYEPVSGEIDPSLSVRELRRPGFFSDLERPKAEKKR
jgi:hypothetical protein